MLRTEILVEEIESKKKEAHKNNGDKNDNRCQLNFRAMSTTGVW